MTEREAIKQIKNNIKQCCANISCEWEKDEEALNIAIKALEKQICANAMANVLRKHENKEEK